MAESNRRADTWERVDSILPGVLRSIGMPEHMIRTALRPKDDRDQDQGREAA